MEYLYNVHTIDDGRDTECVGLHRWHGYTWQGRPTANILWQYHGTIMHILSDRSTV